MEQMPCPECGQVNPMQLVVNEVRQCHCSRCGMVYYAPDSCLTDDKRKPGQDPGPKSGA